MYKQVIKASFLASVVTRCCRTALHWTEANCKRKQEKFGPSSVHTVMQSLMYIKRTGEYGTPVCTLGIHSITQKSEQLDRTAAVCTGRGCPLHIQLDLSSWFGQKGSVHWVDNFSQQHSSLAMSPAWQTSIIRSNPINC